MHRLRQRRQIKVQRLFCCFLLQSSLPEKTLEHAQGILQIYKGCWFFVKFPGAFVTNSSFQCNYCNSPRK
jgi:hypothetical protein